jgi:hypothetical protein
MNIMSSRVELYNKHPHICYNKKVNEKELFQQRWIECAKEATYQVLGTLQTCALLGGTQRVEEGNLLHEHPNTKKHPVVIKY